MSEPTQSVGGPASDDEGAGSPIGAPPVAYLRVFAQKDLEERDWPVTEGQKCSVYLQTDAFIKHLYLLHLCMASLVLRGQTLDVESLATRDYGELAKMTCTHVMQNRTHPNPFRGEYSGPGCRVQFVPGGQVPLPLPRLLPGGGRRTLPQRPRQPEPDLSEECKESAIARLASFPGSSPQLG